MGNYYQFESKQFNGRPMSLLIQDRKMSFLCRVVFVSKSILKYSSPSIFRPMKNETLENLHWNAKQILQYFLGLLHFQ